MRLPENGSTYHGQRAGRCKPPTERTKRAKKVANAVRTNGELQNLESSSKRIENPSQPISINEHAAQRDSSARSQPVLKRMLKLREATFYSGLSKNRLRELIQRGELPYLKCGEGVTAGWLIDQSDLDDWIARNKQRHGE